MVNGISGINGVNPVNYQTQANNNQVSNTNTSDDNFDIEDNAIISAQAKLLNEFDKYNSGQGNEVDLAVTRVTSENQVKAMVNVINTKKDMMDSILKLGE